MDGVEKFIKECFKIMLVMSGVEPEISIQGLDNIDVTGVQVSYYFICRTKLWLFSHYIQLESESDLVDLAKQIHKESYGREEKELRIGPIKFDFIRREDHIEVHEVKKTRKMEEAHEYQVLYYLYYLDKKGINAKGKIEYPKLKENKEIRLTDSRKQEMEEILSSIRDVVGSESYPDPVWKQPCKKCAYREFCFS